MTEEPEVEAKSGMQKEQALFSDRSYTTPWTLRVYEAIPGSIISKGIGFTIILLLIYFAGRVFFDGGNNSTPDDLRVAVTQILITTYSATAYAYLLMTGRRTTRELTPVAQHIPQWQAIKERAGKHPWWILFLVGMASVLIVGVPITNATTPAPVDPWAWKNWNYDIWWHRTTMLFFVWWIGCFNHITVVESARLSRLSDGFNSLDLLDLDPYRPLVRQGLSNALVVIGMISVMSLLGVESRYGYVLAGLWLLFVLLAWTGLMLPLRGIRRQISLAKAQELQWCKQALRTARDEMKTGAESQQSITEITSYKALVEGIRNWPFDNPTLVRFTLYLLIPLGSWLGGAVVERSLDFFLS